MSRLSNQRSWPNATESHAIAGQSASSGKLVGVTCRRRWLGPFASATNTVGIVCLVVPALTIALARPALASEGHSGPSVVELVWQGVNLILLLGVLFAVARKPISAYFAERREQIKSDIATADALLADSRRQFAEWQGKLVELEAEIETIRSESRSRAEDEREQIVAAAHDRAERIKADAVAAIDQELRRAHEELRQEAANLAVDLATRLLDEQVDDRDRDRLLDEFITHVEPNGSANGTGR